MSGFDMRKTTNGERGEVFSAAFAVVIFMLALDFVGLHESSAWAHTGLITNSCRCSRHNRVFPPRPAKSSVCPENLQADARASHAAPASLRYRFVVQQFSSDNSPVKVQPFCRVSIIYNEDNCLATKLVEEWMTGEP
jgi:hypothetical protein